MNTALMFPLFKRLVSDLLLLICVEINTITGCKDQCDLKLAWVQIKCPFTPQSVYHRVVGGIFSGLKFYTNSFQRESCNNETEPALSKQTQHR